MSDITSFIVLFAIFVVASMWERHNLLKQAAEERRVLEGRLIALTDRDASVMVHAQETHEPGSVTYVDEARELELYGE